MCLGKVSSVRVCACRTLEIASNISNLSDAYLTLRVSFMFVAHKLGVASSGAKPEEKSRAESKSTSENKNPGAGGTDQPKVGALSAALQQLGVVGSAAQAKGISGLSTAAAMALHGQQQSLQPSVLAASSQQTVVEVDETIAVVSELFSRLDKGYFRARFASTEYPPRLSLRKLRTHNKNRPSNSGPVPGLNLASPKGASSPSGLPSSGSNVRSVDLLIVSVLDTYFSFNSLALIVIGGLSICGCLLAQISLRPCCVFLSSSVVKTKEQLAVEEKETDKRRYHNMLTVAQTLTTTLLSLDLDLTYGCDLPPGPHAGSHLPIVLEHARQVCNITLLLACLLY